jgi:hypothetical protein
VFVEDLDKDGLNDLIFSSPGWHHIIILWGTGDKFTLGNDMTVIDDQYKNSKIGDSMDIGDIDNDGWLDLVAGAPFKTNETISRYECGIIYVYFNISKAREGSFFDTDELSHPSIWGSGSYDRFGFLVNLHDIDSDGYDDIIVGSPDADGFQNQRNGAGQIMIYQGGSKAKFSKTMDSDNDADILIYGDRVRKGDDPGDSTGRSFSIGDIDGDGAPELVIGFPRRENDDGVQVGAIVGYETRTVFTTPSSLVDLRNAEKRFEFLGETVNDNLGYTVHIGDINDDGAEEIAAGSPGADGIGDIRVGAGEVFIFKGTKISIIDLEFSGPGIKDGILYPGLGNIYLNFSFRHSIDPRLVNNAYVEFDPDHLPQSSRTAGLKNDIWYDDAHFINMDKPNSTLSYIGSVGKISLVFNTGWFLKMNEPYDVKVYVSDEGGLNVTRRFLDALPTVQNLLLNGSADLDVDGKPVGNNNQWLSPDSDITISGFKVTYGNDPHIKVSPGVIRLLLFRDDLQVDDVVLTSSMSSLSDTVPTATDVRYEIIPQYAIDPPAWSGKPYAMGLKGKITLDLNIDETPPSPPEGLYLEPDEGRISIFDNDRDWKVGWGSIPGDSLDEGSSVKEFTVSLDEGEEITARSLGGLFGSYYNGYEFNEHMFDRIDSPVHFPISEWESFGPEPELLHYNNFSIRWNGWFRVPTSRSYQFSLSGTANGYGKVVMDDIEIIPWSRLTSSLNSPPRFLNEGEMIPLEIYYYFNSMGYKDPEEHLSGISFKYLNNKGLMVPIPPEELYYPSNTTSFDLFLEEEFTISVTAVDWVGLRSDPVTISGYMDTADPVMNLSSFRSWYGSPAPTINVGFRDPTFGGIPSSGIDNSTIEYRIRGRGNDSFSDWKSEGISHADLVEGLENAFTRIEAEFDLSLEPSWRGSIQWRIADRVGNVMESSIVDFGIDSKGPEFELQLPNLQVVQDEGVNKLITKVFDRPGSGVDMDTIAYRLDSGEGWSGWITIDENGSGEEVIFELSLDLPSGQHKFQFKCNDLVGNEGRSSIYLITTAPVIENRPPFPGIRVPINGTVIKLGNPLSLDASNTQDDNQGPFKELRYTWISNIDGYLGSGRILDVYLDNLGEHRVRLYVDDGEFNVSTSVYVTVQENNPNQPPPDDDDLESPSTDYVTPLLISLIFIVIMVIGFILLMRRYREKKEEETRLDFVERTEDDVDYERRLEEEEKKLGIHVEKNNKTEKELEEERKELYGDS